MSSRRVRSSRWPFVLAALVLAPLVAFVVFSNTDAVPEVRLPESTSLTTTPATDAPPPSSAPAGSKKIAGSPAAISESGAPVPPSTSTSAEADSDVDANSDVTDGQRSAKVVVRTGDPIDAVAVIARLYARGWADVSRTPVPATGPAQVLVYPGFEAAGRLVATDLGLSAEVVVVDEFFPPSAAVAADVIVIMGSTG